MYFVQHWLNLTDMASEDVLLDSTALRRFVSIHLGRERVPAATTLLKCPRLLEQHKLGEALFAKVGQVLQANGMKVGNGPILHAMISGYDQQDRASGQSDRRNGTHAQPRQVAHALAR